MGKMRFLGLATSWSPRITWLILLLLLQALPVQSFQLTSVPRYHSSSTTTSLYAARRKKKNKYEQYSRVTGQADPLEQLMVESKLKNEAIFQEKQQQQLRSNHHSNHTHAMLQESTTNLHFPASIDPYDPSSFGYTELGTISGAHGVSGWLRVRHNDLKRCLTPQKACVRHIRPAHKRAPRAVVLLQGKETSKGETLIQLESVTNRDQAMGLRGACVYIRQETLLQEEESSLSDNNEQEEYQVADLVGLEVFLSNEQHDAETEKQFVGIVAGVVFAQDLSNSIHIPGMHDSLELRIPFHSHGGSSFRDELVLIPFVPQIVPVVDLEVREIYIDPPSGLLDLTYVRQDKMRIKGFLPKGE